MKRLHIHLRTDDLPRSAQFYEALFGQPPTVREKDYAKWQLTDPPANIALSTHEGPRGIDHVGVSLDDEPSLEAAAERLAGAGFVAKPEPAAQCCYAQSNKYWAQDPQGTLWELFQTFGAIETYGQDPDRPATLSSQPPADLAVADGAKACAGPGQACQ